MRKLYTLIFVLKLLVLSYLLVLLDGFGVDRGLLYVYEDSRQYPITGLALFYWSDGVCGKTILLEFQTVCFSWTEAVLIPHGLQEVLSPREERLMRGG